MDIIDGYVHGYSTTEARRLFDQADTLAGLLHAGTAFRPGDRVLEVAEDGGTFHYTFVKSVAVEPGGG